MNADELSSNKAEPWNVAKAFTPGREDQEVGPDWADLQQC